MPPQADSIFFTLVERRWVTILKHAENYFCQFFFFFHFTPSVLCSHHHGGFLEGMGGGSVSWRPQMHKIFVKLYGFVESKVGVFFFFFFLNSPNAYSLPI